MADTNRTTRHDPPARAARGELIPRSAVDVQTVRPAMASRSAVPAEQGMASRLVWTALRRWWWIATPIGLLLAAAGGTAVYLLFEPMYEAAAWFKIEERTPFLAFETKDDGRAKVFFQTQIETIRSPLVLGPVVKRPEIAQIPGIAAQPDKVAWLAKQIKVTSVGESELFRILFADPDPKAAAAVVNAVTEAYFALRDQSDSERNQRVIDMLDREKDKRAKEVVRLRDNLRDLAKEASVNDPYLGNMESEKQPQVHPLADLEGRLIAAQVERTVLEARLKAAEEELSAAKDAGDPAAKPAGESLSPQDIAMRDAMVDKMVESNPEVQQQKAIIAAKQASLKDTEQKLAKGKADPRYVALADEIRSDEESLDKLRTELKPGIRREFELTMIAKRAEAGTRHAAKRFDDRAKMRADLAASRVMEQMLKERYDEQRKNVEQGAGDTMELAFKRDELIRAEKVFELIAQRSLELQTERGAPGRVALMRLAEAPSAPVVSFPFRNMALAILAGLCMPFGLAIAWERLMGRVGDSQSLERQSPLSVLGEISHLPRRATVASGESFQGGYEVRLFEESIDSLRTSLTLSDELADMRVLTVTSASNHEGKTSVAAQLAVSFAKATGSKLLLIDGDMRSPDIHRVFDVPLEPGLVDVLSGACPLEDAIVTGWSDHVHLLPAGRLKESPHTLLGNGAWKSLLARIPDDYRYVLIDTPPVLAASEALVLAKAADAALVCTMRDVSRVDQVREVIGRLAAAGCRPVGTVLNGVPTRRYASRYGHYGYISK